MIKLTMLCLPACLLLMACQQQPTPPAANQEALQKEVNELFDAYSSTTKGKDVAGVSALLAEDGLFVGTDPGEFWNKKRLLEEFGKMVEDSTFNFEVTLEKREVRISGEGTMALVVEQMTVPFISKNILVRGVGHARKSEGRWQIDFYSWSLIPKNEDLPKLNAALEEVAISSR